MVKNSVGEQQEENNRRRQKSKFSTRFQASTWNSLMKICTSLKLILDSFYLLAVGQHL